MRQAEDIVLEVVLSPRVLEVKMVLMFSLIRGYTREYLKRKSAVIKSKKKKKIQ